MFEMENTNNNNKQTDHVFISFRGKDNRHTFLSHLKQKLMDCKVSVLTDENVIGKPLKKIFKLIRISRIAIVIFSKSYPESDWCWDELVHIQNCRETKQLKAIIPIFHNVDVSTVEQQSEEFGEKFQALQISLLSEKGIGLNDIKDINWKIENWKKALIAVTKMGGFSYYDNSAESDFVTRVVEKVLTYLPLFSAVEGRTSTPVTREVNQSNQIVYNINQLNVNNYHLHISKSFQDLIPETYNMSVDWVNPFPGDFKRNNSDLDHRDQYRPFPFEARMVQKPPVEEIMVQKPPPILQSIDNDPEKKDSHTSYLSCLRYCLERCLCLNKSKQKRIQTICGNEPSLAIN